MKTAMILVVLGGGLLAGCQQPSTGPSLAHARLPESPRPVADFQLLDQHGRSFTTSDLHGQWTVLFSGFTHCPDVCPATLGLFKAVESRLDGAPGYQTVFVSVDPERDTPETLREYLGWFDPDWTGLTGESDQLDRLLGSLDMAHVRVPTGKGDYTVDHATAVVLIDPEASMVGYWMAPLEAEALAEDLGRLPTP